MGFTVYDLAVEYRMTADQQRLTERRLAGPVVAVPLAAWGIAGRASMAPLHDGGLAVTGTATAANGTAPADLVVLLSGRVGVAVALPGPAQDGPNPLGWFSITRRRPLPEGGLVALLDGRGALIPLAPTPQTEPPG